MQVYGIDLMNGIFRSAFVHDTQALPQVSWCYKSWSYLVFLQGKVNSARYIAPAVNPVLLSFIRQQGVVLFQQDNARPHTAAATQSALHSVQILPWPARSPNLLPIERVWDMMKRELSLSPESARTIVGLRQRVQDA